MQIPQNTGQWVAQYEKTTNDADVDAILDVCVPMNETVAADYADLILGIIKTVANLRCCMKFGTPRDTHCLS